MLNPPEWMSGLQGYTFGIDDKAMKRVISTLEKLEIPMENTPAGKQIFAPWGIEITLN